MINSAYQSLTNVFSQLTRAGAAATRVLTLMDNLPDINLFEGETVTNQTRFDLEFRNVKFFYQMRPDNVVLKNFSLKLGEDKVVALVGRSVGKSTVAHLLMRFYDPKDGEILLDGKPLPSYRLSTFMRGSGL